MALSRSQLYFNNGKYELLIAVFFEIEIDLSTVSWYQGRMQDHLHNCLEKRKLEMFPHEVKQVSNTKSHYVISIYCVCCRHIPGAQMVLCSRRNNWFHHGLSQTCMNLSAKQVAALTRFFKNIVHRYFEYWRQDYFIFTKHCTIVIPKTKLNQSSIFIFCPDHT